MDFLPKKIDWYIFKKFMLTFFMAMLLIIVIVIVFDISEKIDKFIANQAPLKLIITQYYVNFIPYFMNMFSPLFVFITVIFFTSRMAANSEIIAILSCGISYRRMMVPYIAGAALIAAMSFGLNHFVIPKSNAIRVEFEKTYIKDKSRSIRNVHYQISPGEFVYVESFSQWNNTAYRFTLEKVDSSLLVSKLSAESAVYDPENNSWKLRKWNRREYTEGLEDKVVTGATLDTVINLSSKDFYFNEKTVQTLDRAQLNEYIKTQEMRGDSNVQYSLIEKYTRTAMPFSAFILTIMGVALSSRKKRGSIGLNLGVGIALSFSYILFQKFSQMFVFTGLMSPLVAIWIPNVLYAFIAAFLYSKAQK